MTSNRFAWVVSGAVLLLVVVTGLLVAMQPRTDIAPGSPAGVVQRYVEAVMDGDRFALGTLVATGSLAAYHWLIYDSGRDAMRAQQRGPHYVLLIGPKDDTLEHAIEHATGGRVHTWTPTNGFAGVWTRNAVLHEVDVCTDDTLILFAEGSRLLAVPVVRD